jgi:hypothetical protein
LDGEETNKDQEITDNMNNLGIEDTSREQTVRISGKDMMKSISAQIILF